MRLVLLLLFAGLTASNLHAQQQNLIKAYKSPKDTNILDPEGVKHIVLSDDEDLESIDQFLNVTHVQVKGEILDNVASQSQVCLMGEVRFLDLSNNDLSELPTGFSCVNKLTTIVLNQNRIEDIPAILDFERLDEIYLNSNKLSQVPKSIAKKTSLKKLYLDNNDIEKLNSLSKHQLTNLSVANNRILQLPKNFESIQTLKFLDISGNGVADLSSFYVSMMDLEELNLSENEFTEIPEDIFALRNLKALDLSKNKIENVDERFKAFTKLEDLRLSENTLYNFKGLPFLTSVKHLDLAHTPIRILPFEIKEMESLEYLDASRCLIKSIKALKGAQQLTYLDLNKNKLEEFPEDLDLWALEYLDVDANKIQTVHGVVKSCPNLSTLHASFETTASLNEIGELKHLEDLELTCDINGPVPLGVGKLEKLRALKMTSCNLFDISVLAKNTALKTLDVSDNNIIQIPEQMSNLKDLEVLNVSNNHDISSYVGLKGMQSLKTVDLSNNSLEYIPEELYYLKNIETVILEGNDISAEEIKLFQERFPEKELRL